MKLQAITGSLAESGCKFPSIDLLQPADPFLDTTGEDLRRRIFITQENTGKTLCLRPEFTIPVCLAHLKQGDNTGRYAYAGSVFRQRDKEPQEFTQAGFEDFGDQNRLKADINCINIAIKTLQQAGQQNLGLTLGDQSIFSDLLEALDIPSAWRKKLTRNFGDTELLIENLSVMYTMDEEFLTNIPKEYHALLENADTQRLEALIGERMSEDGLSPTFGRTPNAIADRLMQKLELSSAALDEEKYNLLQSFLAIDVTLADAPLALAQYQKASGLDLKSGQERLAAMAKAISEYVGDARYRANFGRRLDYYTGLVFEIYSGGSQKPLIGGGRYDQLMTLLGSPKEIPAVGFSIWVDRLEAAL
ncbi:MAG: ATP phosphoribosyltransferase regulatory subunit [Pseudomonadota bacterium]